MQILELDIESSGPMSRGLEEGSHRLSRRDVDLVHVLVRERLPPASGESSSPPHCSIPHHSRRKESFRFQLTSLRSLCLCCAAVIVGSSSEIIVGPIDGSLSPRPDAYLRVVGAIAFDAEVD